MIRLILSLVLLLQPIYGSGKRRLADANFVDIDVRGQTDYYGPLYVGQQYFENYMIYDTMSDWTVINDAEADNQQIPNNYEQFQSNTSSITLDRDGDPQSRTLDFGSIQITGDNVKDQVCLIKYKNYLNKVTNSTLVGNFCLDQFEFIASKEIIGDMNSNGILGLAPTDKSYSIVKALYEQEKIPNQIVMLNYENPQQKDVRSQVLFGSIDYSLVMNEKFNYYSNLAQGKWGLMMDDFLYNGVDMSSDHVGKIALIDSGNTSIQMPASIFNKTFAEIKKQDPSIYTHEVDGNEIIVSRTPCHKLESKLHNIEFMLQKTKIVIKPHGYIYHMEDQYEDCFIGLQSIPDEIGQYRLGTIFLRNFVVALDYGNNLIMIGQNLAAADHSDIIGETEQKSPLDDINKHLPIPERHGNVVIIVIILLVCLLVILFWITHKRPEGEITPKKIKLQINSINESIDASLLEDEDEEILGGSSNKRKQKPVTQSMVVTQESVVESDPSDVKRTLSGGENITGLIQA